MDQQNLMIGAAALFSTGLLIAGLGITVAASAAQGMEEGYSSHALQQSKAENRSALLPGHYGMTAKNGYLVGGEGQSGDAVQSEGKMIWEGPSEASIYADGTNTGLVIGTVRTHGHTYSLIMNTFSEKEHYMDGGIARDLYLHGLTGHGQPMLPQMWAYLAGWGKDCTIYKDGKVLHQNVECHFHGDGGGA